MKTIIRKVFFNFEKEEIWLNEMSAKGFALTDYSWCRYVFSDCEAAEYTYRIELLEYPPAHAVSQKYIRFMEESGAEHIASYRNWVYFRKKALASEFDIYSDTDSKIKHYQRISRSFSIVAGVEFLVCIFYFVIMWPVFVPNSSLNMATSTAITTIYAVIGAFAFSAGTLFVWLVRYYRKKIKKLVKNKEIME